MKIDDSVICCTFNLPEAEKVANFLFTSLMGDTLNMDSGRHREQCEAKVLCLDLGKSQDLFVNR